MHLSERENEILRGILDQEMTRKEERLAFNAATGRDMDREHFRRVVQRLGKEPEVVWDPEAVLSAHKNQAKTGSSGIHTSKLRVVIPDSHGCYSEGWAIKQFLDELALVDPDEIVMLGDHVDVSGIYNSHPPNYLGEMHYSYSDDLGAANAFLDSIQKRAPRASIIYLEGNHEAHVEREIVRRHHAFVDASAECEVLAPAAKLRLADRGIKYFKISEFHHGLSTRGMIKLGKCYYTHGNKINTHATASHLAAVSACVVHGHTHRSAQASNRTVTSDAILGWCPGTLSTLAPMWRHNDFSSWTHGWALEAFEPSGRFVHVNVPLVKGMSLVKILLDGIRPSELSGAD